MPKYKQIFMRGLQEKRIAFTDFNERQVRIVYTGNNLKSIPIHISFDEDDDRDCELFCLEIANFNDKVGEGLVLCNSLNEQYRWVRFYLDDDNDLVVAADGDFSENFVCDDNLVNIQRLVNAIDLAYPQIAQELWG